MRKHDEFAANRQFMAENTWPSELPLPQNHTDKPERFWAYDYVIVAGDEKERRYCVVLSADDNDLTLLEISTGERLMDATNADIVGNYGVLPHSGRIVNERMF